MDSIDDQLGEHAVETVKVYPNGVAETYRPSESPGFPLYAGEGVVVDLAGHVKGKWRVSTKIMRFSKPPTLHLNPGWNFVAVPYPANGLTIDQLSSELATSGNRVKEISVGPEQEKGVTYRPTRRERWKSGATDVPNAKGIWVKVGAAATWTPGEESEEPGESAPGEFEEQFGAEK